MTGEQLQLIRANRFEALVDECPTIVAKIPPEAARLIFEAGFMAGLEHQLEVSREQFAGTVEALAGAER